MPRLLRDGVGLVYEEAGHGSAPPMVLVHGLACDRRYFAPQFQYYQQSRRTIAVDLRGHGESDKPVQAYTMEGLADDLAWLCASLGIERPVVVGHSMGGIVALHLAARHPALPAAVVMVDMPTAALAGPPSPDGPLFHILERLRGPEYPQRARRFVERMFLPTDDAARRAWIVDAMTAAPQHVFASVLEHVWDCDLEGAAAGCAVPALFIQAVAPRPELPRLRELCPHLVTGQTVGAGHFNMLEVPEQVNAMIDRFLLVSGITA